MNTEVYETLEFDKLLERLASLTISPLGDEQIASLSPLDQLSTIETALTEVTELREILDFDDPFPIDGLEDIRPAIKRAAVTGNYLGPEELAHVCTTLAVFRRIKKYVADRPGKYPHLSQHVREMTPLSSIEKEIERCIDLQNHTIYDHASPNLARLRRSIESSRQKLRKLMETLLGNYSKQNYLQENLITIRNDRLVLMLKDEYRNKVRGLIHDQSATGATLFIEPLPALDMNNQIRALEIDEKREIEKILLQLTSLLTNELETLKHNVLIAAWLDGVYAKARLSVLMHGSQPLINDNQQLEIINGKHPLLLLKAEKSGGEVVPLTLRLGEQHHTLIITGPNAGGKTVALKTIGLLSLMTACGLHIPADPNSNIAIFKHIFSAIGDQQSIENDLSTFSSHIEQLKNITDNADDRSLAIIDEICAGTDPEEGAALAISVMEHLTSSGCLTVVSTHLGALKAFAHETEGIENGSMEFNAESLEPTYRFRSGMPGSSYAFEIAERWGLNHSLIERSRALVGEEKHKLENLLIELDKRMTAEQLRLNDLSIKQTELDGLLKIYREKSKELAESEKKLKKNAAQEAEAILASANTAIEQAIKSIREEQASREAIKTAKTVISEEKARVRKLKTKVAPQQEAELLSSVAIGQHVRWKPYGKLGIVLSSVDAANKVLLDAGGMKVKVPLSELETAASEKKSKPMVHVRVDTQPTISSTELDLRGMRAEEAVAMTDKFIEEALITGLRSVSIIHGKGTGALRQAVNKFLDKHDHVVHKQLGNWNEGGTGVTVVELK
ncbi:endonuclease MutS2 [candidate division KSB1 bacterium]|nr:endonuclease MutS2 [candidate division KSB1 bacterium]